MFVARVIYTCFRQGLKEIWERELNNPIKGERELDREFDFDMQPQTKGKICTCLHPNSIREEKHYSTL